MNTIGRDAKGRLLPGHRLSFNLKRSTGQKVGRPKTIAGEVRSALQIAEDAMPQLYLDMIRDAQDPKASIQSRQMCREYLSDRIYGKPNQPLSGLGGKGLEIIVRWDGNRNTTGSASATPTSSPS